MINLLKDKKWAIFFSLVAMLLWGSAIPMIKSMYDYGNILSDDSGGKILIAGCRFFLAGIVTFIYFKIFDGSKIKRGSINLKLILILGLMQTAVQYLFYYIGLSNTLGTMASVIQASNAFIVVILSVILIKDEKLTKNKIIALVLGSIGVLILNLNKEGGFHFRIEGEGFILIATTFNALSSIIVRKYSRGQNPFILTASQFIVGSVLLIIIGMISHTSDININPLFIILLFYGAFISATSFSIWTIVLQNHSSSEFGIYKLFIPIFGTILSVLILGETLTIKIIIALVFVLVGALILNKN